MLSLSRSLLTLSSLAATLIVPVWFSEPGSVFPFFPALNPIGRIAGRLVTPEFATAELVGVRPVGLGRGAVGGMTPSIGRDLLALSSIEAPPSFTNFPATWYFDFKSGVGVSFLMSCFGMATDLLPACFLGLALLLRGLGKQRHWKVLVQRDVPPVR